MIKSPSFRIKNGKFCDFFDDFGEIQSYLMKILVKQMRISSAFEDHLKNFVAKQV